MSAYSFQQVTVGQFTAYRSAQVLGDTHCKRFTGGVTPQNQQTLNVYIAGDFEFTCGDFTQVLHAGDTSLDLTIGEFPAGVVCTEKVLSPTALRICVSPPGKGSWSREKVAVTGSISFAEESALVVMGGEVDGKSAGDLIYARPGQVIVGNGLVMRCWFPG